MKAPDFLSPLIGTVQNFFHPGAMEDGSLIKPSAVALNDLVAGADSLPAGATVKPAASASASPSSSSSSFFDFTSFTFWGVVAAAGLGVWYFFFKPKSRGGRRGGRKSMFN